MAGNARGLLCWKSQQAAPDSKGRGTLLQQVSKRLGNVQVLNQINLEVGQGECAVLIGRNGSGKSTLLRILAGILLPDTGTVHRTIKGSEMYALDGLPRLPFTSAEYLWDMGRIRGVRPKVLRQRISELSELLFLGTAIDQKLPLLSKGTLQKVNLIQALLPGPGGLLLLDEPLSGLDVPAQESIVSLLRKWKYEGASIVTVCHEPLLIERLADQVIVLQKGKVFRHWSREDLQQVGEPVVSIQSLKDSNDPNQSLLNLKVARRSVDGIIRMILEAGGSIVSVQQEKSQLHMESLLEGHHPAETSFHEQVTESVVPRSVIDAAGGDAP
ncbi:ATP-binding cassette domain-containing protein [Paenibacillus sp. QZ-Y1]|uniref:ATP-binding cassette domain-containing protein n=1 Tax=Paenibacillus sp. QZ-Y1 TaxID=3414511 RepID=UPI003F79AD67